VANAALTSQTSASVVNQRTVASTNIATAQNLYLNVGTALATAATDVYIYGFDLSA